MTTPLPPPTDQPAATTAHDTLTSSLLPLLDAFNHRHANQHRASHWWSSLSLLRRSLRALVPRLRRLALVLKQQQQQKKKQPQKQESARRPELAAVVVRVRHLQQHVVPKAYIVFSQLAADNQYAPLGILLLAALAQTSATLSLLSPVPDEAPPPPPPSSAHPARRDPSIPADKPGANPHHTAPASTSTSIDHDRGVVVSRQDLLSSRKRKLDGDQARSHQQPASQPAHLRPSTDKPKPAKVDRSGHRPVAEKLPSPPVKPREPKKKKSKKKKDGDDLASLFSSLT